MACNFLEGDDKTPFGICRPYFCRAVLRPAAICMRCLKITIGDASDQSRQIILRKILDTICQLKIEYAIIHISLLLQRVYFIKLWRRHKKMAN